MLRAINLCSRHVLTKQRTTTKTVVAAFSKRPVGNRLVSTSRARLAGEKVHFSVVVFFLY